MIVSKVLELCKILEDAGYGDEDLTDNSGCDISCVFLDIISELKNNDPLAVKIYKAIKEEQP